MSDLDEDAWSRGWQLAQGFVFVTTFHCARCSRERRNTEVFHLISAPQHGLMLLPSERWEADGGPVRVRPAEGRRFRLGRTSYPRPIAEVGEPIDVWCPKHGNLGDCVRTALEVAAQREIRRHYGFPHPPDAGDSRL